MANEQLVTSQTLDVRTLCGVAGKCVMIPAAGTPNILVQSQTQCFVDQLGQNQTSNLLQTRADGNFHGAAVSTGEILTIFGVAIQIGVLTGPAPFVSYQTVVNAPPRIIQDVLSNLSLELTIKGQVQQIGSLQTLPSTMGPDGYSRNGGANVPQFRFPPSLALQLTGNQTFSMRFTAERQIVMLNNDDSILIAVNCTASRGIPIANLPGA